jgi:hypothetical protein
MFAMKVRRMLSLILYFDMIFGPGSVLVTPSRPYTTTLFGAMVMPQDHSTSTIVTERWLAIVGRPGYEVSDLGRHRSYKRMGDNRHGVFAASPKTLKGTVDKASGYVRVDFGRSTSDRRNAHLHVLILEAFVGPRPPGMEGCHYDGNPGNNRLDNLRWDYASSNQLDRHRHGTMYHARLTPQDIPNIWARLVAGQQPTEIARDYGVTSWSVSFIKRGTSWSHITRHLEGTPTINRRVKGFKGHV